MNNYLNLIFSDIKKLWDGLELFQKVSICVLVIAAVAAMVFFVTKSTEPNWSVLYSDLQENDVVNVTESLKKNGYKYKLSDDKKTILVPVDQKEDLRIFVAENDIIKDSSPGFELLDKVQLGATDFQNKLTKQRIYQGELTRTIERISGVQKARIQLADPERSVFSDNDEEPSASVMLVLVPGVTLKTEQVKAIKNLVAYGVPRLKPEKVFLSDQNGDVLSDEIHKNSNDIETYKTTFEKNTAKKITKVLERIVGSDNVSVEVSADINFDSAKATIEKYVPLDGSNEGILASTQSETELYDKGSNKPQTAQNQTETQTANVNDKTMNYQKNKMISNYNVSKEIKQVVYAPGSVNRMTVAVAINKILTEEESKELQDLVISAAGANIERGDIVKITSMEFSGLDAEQVNASKMMKEIQTENQVNFWVTKIGPLLVVLILGLFALFIIKSMLKKPYQGEVVRENPSYDEYDDYAMQEAELERLAQESQQLLSTSNMPILEAKLAPELEMMKSQLNNMIMTNPEDASRLILSFIKD
ncbi:MAG: flagellar basal-body MS-ring/collar protein FliF [Candidatus Gastranaerophilales bacterium]|nr:flagellar basal-body MS-ring/collar protein FliF [Candidatus Gastranaerophilales bacterium]